MYTFSILNEYRLAILANVYYNSLLNDDFAFMIPKFRPTFLGTIYTNIENVIKKVYTFMIDSCHLI